MIRPPRLAVSLLVAVLAAGLPAAPAKATPTAPAWTVGTESGNRAGHWVTLVTGDRVLLEGDQVAIEPAPGRERMTFSRYERDGHQHVVPADALRPVAAGRVDPRLFDVTGLVESGYHDAATADVPLIVGYPAGKAAPLRAARVARALPSVRGAAVRVGKAEAASFWAGAAAARLWLDGKRQVSLDESVAQIGAPAAWQAGYDGSGVTVAVLDTGIDATHPDFAGRIVAARNFTDAPNTDDILGHGTHVASTVAGSGAASAGRYAGVAPKASLLIGKVCPDRNCPESAILAGMEWAAPQAKVVNLSLGGPDGPEIDPLEEAANRLTAQTGALFVAAAGNDGRDAYVGSPASADAALAVGAVDKQDRYASFSNRGPRADGAIKPEITGPGVDITAALSKDSAYPVSEPRYTTLSGTSMATPHVAGAAALLAQQHAHWTAAEIKAALMGAAKPNPDLSAYHQGAGRVDVARAVGQAVLAGPTALSLGTAAWPAGDDEPVSRTVTYRNAGTAAATLDVAVPVQGPDGAAAPAGMFTVSPAWVTVPAGGEAAVTVTADTRVPSATGQFHGAVVATGGAVSVRVPLTIGKAHASTTLTLRHLDRAGAAAATYETFVVGVDHDAFYNAYHASGTATLRLRPGRYHVSTNIVSADGSNTMLVHPALTVTEAGGEIELDARRGTPVSVSVPRRSARTFMAAVGLAHTMPSGRFVSRQVIGSEFATVYTADIGGGAPADAGTLVSEVRGAWREPGEPTATPYEYHVAFFERGRFLDNVTRAVRARELATVTHHFHAESPGQTGYLVNFGRPAEGNGGANGVSRLAYPTTRTMYYLADGVKWETRSQVNGASLVQQWAGPMTLTAGRRYEKHWQNGPLRPNFGSRSYVWRSGNTMSFHLPPFGDQEPDHSGFSLLDTGRIALYQDGRQLVEVPKYFWDAQGPVTALPATYRLELSTTRPAAAYSVATRIDAAWTWRSAEVSADGPTYQPLSVFQFSPELDLMNTAPAGRAFVLPVRLDRQPGAASAALRRFTVEVSYDEGVTWKATTPVKTGKDRWAIALFHPAKAGSVSLRASAGYADGSTADYTVIRGYALR